MFDSLTLVLLWSMKNGEMVIILAKPNFDILTLVPICGREGAKKQIRKCQDENKKSPLKQQFS